jgi:hypothetical protein
MPNLLVRQSFPIFTDRKGEPLEGGFIYIGTAGVDPEVQANRIVAYFDKDATPGTEAAQPIRTVGGFPVNDSNKAVIYVAEDDYSIKVCDKNNVVVYQSLNVTDEVYRASGEDDGLDLQVAANTANIAANTSAIGVNTSNIAANTSQVGANTTNIASNTSAISSNTSAIGANTSNINTNAASILANSSAIATLQSQMATVISDIATLQGQTPVAGFFETNVGLDVTGKNSCIVIGTNEFHDEHFMVVADFNNDEFGGNCDIFKTETTTGALTSTFAAFSTGCDIRLESDTLYIRTSQSAGNNTVTSTVAYVLV